MLFMRAGGGESSWCVRRGGVGKVSGRPCDAALRRDMEASREIGME